MRPSRQSWISRAAQSGAGIGFARASDAEGSCRVKATANTDAATATTARTARRWAARLRMLSSCHGAREPKRDDGRLAAKIRPDPGRLAQLGEHQLDKLGVTGSSPVPPIHALSGLQRKVLANGWVVLFHRPEL